MKLQELIKNATDCELAGKHIKPKQCGEYAANSLSDPLRDRVLMFCEYCGGTFYRPLNSKELEEIHKFRESLREPMTI